MIYSSFFFSLTLEKNIFKYFRIKKEKLIHTKNKERGKMNENNELLMYIYQNANMGVKSCTNLIRILQGKDNKIKKIIPENKEGIAT